MFIVGLVTTFAGWVSIIYECDIFGGLKLKINILGGMSMILNSMFVNRECGNGIFRGCSDDFRK